MHRSLDKIQALLQRRWFRTASVAIGLGLSLYVIGGMIYRNWSAFQSFSWQLAPLPLAGAAAALAAAFGLNLLTWVLISRTFGSRVGIALVIRRPGQLVDRHLAEMIANLIDAADMVGVGVREHDPLDFLTANARDGFFEHRHVLVVARAGVEKEALSAGANEVGVGARAREPARVLPQRDRDAWR